MTVTITTLSCIDGPNGWSDEPLTRLLVGLQALEDRRQGGVLAATWTLADILALPVDRSSTLRPLPPLPFPDDRHPAAVLGTLALNLQRRVGIPVTFTAFRLLADDRAVEVVIQHNDTVVGEAACRLAARLFNILRTVEEPDPEAIRAMLTRFGTVAASRRYGSAAQPIVAAANARGVPVSRLDPSGRLVELGNGAFRRRVLNSVTSRTPAIAETIAGDKHLTNHYLRAAGLPVPDGAVARTVEQAVAAARAVGYPVVVKPVDGGSSAGLAVDVRDEGGLRAAFPAATAASRSGRALVERYITGNEYRALVVNDEVINVYQRVPAHVVGDGQLTVRRLIEAANADPRRGQFDEDPLKAIVVDEETLALLERQDLALDAVPPAGRRVKLKPTGLVPYGGLSINRTDEVHPDNAAILRQAVRAVDLDIATLDLVAHDIAESIWATSGAILEINTRSGFRFELHPAEGAARDPGPAVVAMLFPPGLPVRAPIVAVAGDPQISGAIGRLIADILTAAGGVVALASRSGPVVAGRPVRGSDDLDPTGVRTVLNHPATEIVVAEVDPQEIVDRGLGFAYCSVAVVTALAGLATPFGKPVETVLAGVVEAGGALVLNADDPGVAALAAPGAAAVVLVGRDPRNPRVEAHVDRGGTAVVVRPAPTGDRIVLLAGETATSADVAPVAHPALAGLPPAGASLAVCAAVAAALARGVPLEAVRRGLA